MLSTNHGLERILERTKMRPEDVLLLVANNGAVELGSGSDGKEFFAFWDPFYNRIKVALLSPDGKLLISVLEANHRLARGLLKIDDKLVVKARVALKEYLLAKLKSKNPQSPWQTYHVKIGVFVKNVTIYDYDAECFSFRNIESRHEILTTVRPALMYLASVVHEKKTKLDKRIRYNVKLADPVTNKAVGKHVSVGHEQVIKFVPIAI